jgi:CBS domain-containing protein
MKVSECMTETVRTVYPSMTIRQAAQLMCELDSGALPVRDNDQLVGMISDRDIAVRAVAQGKDPNTTVGEAMTRDIKYCYEDEDIEHVAHNMGEIQVRRLPVVNRDKRLVGIVTLSDLAAGATPRLIGRTLDSISRPGGSHSQSNSQAA